MDTTATNVNLSLQAHSYAAASQAPLTATGINTPITASGVTIAATVAGVNRATTATGAYTSAATVAGVNRAATATETYTSAATVAGVNRAATATETYTSAATVAGVNRAATVAGVNRATTATETYTSAATVAGVNRAATVAGAYTSAVRHPSHTNTVKSRIDYWSDQIKKIITDYNEGSRVMVVMRGAPGSGKTYLARIIVESTVGTANPNNYLNHVFSADDHMQINGRYHYNVNRLDEVHMKNQTLVFKAVNQGRSPVIVDNTNMTTWEMFAYVRDAVVNGYIIEVVEPSNPWSKNPSQLAKRNNHGVPKEKIQSMLQKYQGSHTGESLLKYFKLCYPKGMEPPVKRNIPAFYKQTPVVVLPPPRIELVTGTSVNQEYQATNSASPNQLSQELQNDNHNINETPCTLKVNNNLKVGESSNCDNQIQQQQMVEKNMDEMLKVEVEWDNGDGWETLLPNREPVMVEATLTDPKPQRSRPNELLGQYIQPSMLHDDWAKNLMFMTPLHNDTVSAVKETAQIKVQAQTTSTLVEIGDFTRDEHKTLIATSRDINEITDHNKNEPILPNHDKSTITHKSFLTGRCEHEEKHFVTMRKMFKSVPRPVLREIFDNCAGDVYWACSIVLDGIKHNNLQTVNTEESDSEEEQEVDCQCEYNQARINIIPGTSTEIMLPEPGEKASPSCTPAFKKKVKKEKHITEDSFILKQQIENTIMIPDNHYSQHYLNMRRPRHNNQGPNTETASTSNENNKDTNPVMVPQNADPSGQTTSGQLSSVHLPHSSAEVRASDTAKHVLYRDIPSTSSANNYRAEPGTSSKWNSESTAADDEDEDDDAMGSDDDKSGMCESENVTVNIGMEFVRKLDELYGRHDFKYPEGVKPVMNIPTKILHDLSLLWVESITQVELQLQLEAEEAESSPEEAEDDLEDDPQEPSEPNLKEIMDTELALALYEREVKEEWKNKEPQDMAAQMTRKKLYELFPDVAHETLSEMLIAHGNSFDNTMEILLISTGQGHYLDQTNGIKKFVIEKEKENKEKYFTKAKWYYDRKKLAEASHYSRIAALHTARYDTANNYAAAALVQVSIIITTTMPLQRWCNAGASKYHNNNNYAAAALVQVSIIITTTMPLQRWCK
ncbi:NEDD4-binding protein [Operophtera brumata]|uniref:NEDD4-binding protein n=1 Tax=Operophtera brumata TaxID=104452 RepID=A0A0L7KS07_OPEBR|nr:NEDD4-binding protein [Operophtera brumata]